MKLKISIIVILVLDILISLVELFLMLKLSNDALVFYIIGIVSLLFALIGLIAPKFTFNVCWRFFSKFSKLDFDYDGGYRRLPKVLFGLSISSLIFQIISLLITIF